MAPEPFRNYFEDLLALPIILSSALLAIQWFVPGQRGYTLSRIDLLVITLLFSIYFEAVLPVFNPAFTSDGVDVLCYVTGAYLFASYLNRPFAPIASL